MQRVARRRGSCQTRESRLIKPREQQQRQQQQESSGARYRRRPIYRVRPGQRTNQTFGTHANSTAPPLRRSLYTATGSNLFLPPSNPSTYL